MADNLPRNLTKREESLELTKRNLAAMNEWAETNRGPCSTCRWRTGGRDYAECTNPAVAYGEARPVEGTIKWHYPRCREERDDEPRWPAWVNAWSKTATNDMKIPTVCGSRGLLWEPRLLSQVVWGWSWKLGIVLVILGMFSCAVWVGHVPAK